MIKKYFALSLITVSLLAAGCSSDDDDDDGTDDVNTGTVDAGMTDGTVDGGGLDGAGGVDNVVDGGTDGEVDGEVDGGMDGEEMSVVNPDAPPADMADGSSAYDVIANSPDHTVLLAAIDAAGLADTLDDPSVTDGFTIFAPTDTAFNSAFAANGTTAADLTEQAITYHVVAGTQSDVAISEGVTAAEATPDAPFTLDSLAGPALTFGTSDTAPAGISVMDGADVSADLATGITPDGATGTGLVYSIDMVLTAPEDDEEVVDGGTTDGTTDGMTDGETETPNVGPVADGAEAALEDDGSYTEFLNAFNAADYDLNMWTVFAPNDDSIGDVDIANSGLDFISTAGAMTIDDLLAAGSVTVNSGNTYTVVQTDEAITVGGRAIALFANGSAGALVYAIDGIPEAN